MYLDHALEQLVMDRWRLSLSPSVLLTHLVLDRRHQTLLPPVHTLWEFFDPLVPSCGGPAVEAGGVFLLETVELCVHFVCGLEFTQKQNVKDGPDSNVVTCIHSL